MASSAWADYVPADLSEARNPVLVPLFGVRPHVPGSPCPHHGLLPDDTSLCCMVCHRTGAKAEAKIARVARAEKANRVNQPVDPGGPVTIKFQAKGK